MPNFIAYRICLNLAKKILSTQVVASSEFYNSLKFQIGPGFRVTCKVLRLANQIKKELKENAIALGFSFYFVLMTVMKTNPAFTY